MFPFLNAKSIHHEHFEALEEKNTDALKAIKRLTQVYQSDSECDKALLQHSLFFLETPQTMEQFQSEVFLETFRTQNSREFASIVYWLCLWTRRTLKTIKHTQNEQNLPSKFIAAARKVLNKWLSEVINTGLEYLLMAALLEETQVEYLLEQNRLLQPFHQKEKAKLLSKAKQHARNAVSFLPSFTSGLQRVHVHESRLKNQSSSLKICFTRKRNLLKLLSLLSFL
jgi:hypothetical protein